MKLILDCCSISVLGFIKKTPLVVFENLQSRGLTIASLEDEDNVCICLSLFLSRTLLSATCMIINWLLSALVCVCTRCHQVIRVKMCSSKDSILIATKGGYAIRFSAGDDQLRPTGRMR